jgi:hypothetical protein
MNFALSLHAQEELVERNIPLQVVQLILDSPEQILEEEGLKVYQGRFTATNGKTYLLRVFVNDQVDPAKVVTAYRTSKIKKYWRE